MTVLINSVETPVTFETERTLSEIVQSLTQWIESQEFSISSLLVDGVASQSVDPQKPIESIDSIELEAVPKSEQKARRFEVYRDYFSLLTQAAEDGKTSVVNDLAQEWNSVLLSARSDLPQPVAGAMNSLDFSQSEGLGQKAREILVFLDRLQEEAADPHKAFERVQNQIPSLLTRLSTLSIDLQKGNDRDAMGKMVELINWIEDILRIVSCQSNSSKFLSEGFDTELWVGELKTYLQEIETALSAQDYVLVSDLVEYEICPRIESLLSREKSH